MANTYLKHYNDKKVREFLTFCRDDLSREEVEKVISNLILIKSDKPKKDSNGENTEIIYG